jgi:hypothetical protein
MTTTTLERPQTGSRKVDVSKGTVDTSVSAQWWRRPDDQRFTSLDELHDQVKRWFRESREETITPDQLRIEANGNRLDVHAGDYLLEPTSYAFEQLCGLAGASQRFIGNRLTPEVAALALEDALQARDRSMVGYIHEPAGKRPSLRALTSESYARIPDHRVVQQLQEMAGNGLGETRWKVPGVMDWSTMTYNPHVPVTKETTTLFASDRDVFVFLCDDLHPIEVGRTKDGEPDLMFRGFYAQNSEVGAYALKIGTMYLRGVCQNRCLWGVEGLSEVYIRHVGQAEERFIDTALPLLQQYADASDQPVIQGVKAAQAKDLGLDDDEERVEFMRRLGFGKRDAEKLLSISLEEEDRPIDTVWDAAQAITAFARDVPHQDERIAVERRAKALLDSAV